MSEKNKIFLKKAIIYILVLALGIFIGIFAVKTGSEYKGFEATAKRLSLNTHIQLNHIVLAGLDDPEALYTALHDECIYMEIMDRTGYYFYDDDEMLSDEEFDLLYGTFVRARDIAEKLAKGKEITEEDAFWIEVFINTVHSSLSGNTNYKTFLDLFY